MDKYLSHKGPDLGGVKGNRKGDPFVFFEDDRGDRLHLEGEDGGNSEDEYGFVRFVVGEHNRSER